MSIPSIPPIPAILSQKRVQVNPFALYNSGRLTILIREMMENTIINMPRPTKIPNARSNSIVSKRRRPKKRLPNAAQVKGSTFRFGSSTRTSSSEI